MHKPRPITPPTRTASEILGFFHVKGRPVYIGEISSNIGWSLERTEGFVEFMVDEGTLRTATGAEIKKLDGCKGARIYALTGKVDPRLAYVP